MKLLSYSTSEGGDIRAGLLYREHVVDIEWGLKYFNNQISSNINPKNLNNIDSVLAEWEENFKLLNHLNSIIQNENSEFIKLNEQPIAFDLSKIKVHSPIPVPNSFRDFYAFEQHVKTARASRNLEMIPEWYQFPVFYFSNHNTFLGHNMPVTYPEYTKELDFELEIACIIGKQGKDIKLEEASQFIAGYSILNDWSARDVQRNEMKVGLGPAKGKDFATSMGPYLITADELNDRKKDKGYDLFMKARKNGVVISQGNWSDIYYSFEELIVRASQGVTLYPGDVLGSGTVGTGCILELRPENTEGWLKKGDVVEFEIERFGILKTEII